MSDTVSSDRVSPAQPAEKLHNLSNSDGKEEGNQIHVGVTDGSVRVKHIDPESGISDEVGINSVLEKLSLEKKMEVISDLLYIFLYHPIGLPHVYFSSRTAQSMDEVNLGHTFYLTVSHYDWSDEKKAKIVIRWHETKKSDHPLHHKDRAGNGVLVTVTNEEGETAWMNRFDQELKKLGEITSRSSTDYKIESSIKT